MHFKYLSQKENALRGYFSGTKEYIKFGERFGGRSFERIAKRTRLERGDRGGGKAIKVEEMRFVGFETTLSHQMNSF